MAEKQPQWVMTQKKTFTKWANVQLAGTYVINDVEKDLSDGIILISLFEALTKKKVSFKFNKQPKMKIAKLENLEQALKFIVADGIKLVNIDAQNIFEGDLKLILGLLWVLILKYQIAANKMDASTQALLDWVNSKIAPKKITNFKSDWNTGDTLNELIKALEPEFIDMGESENKETGAERIKYGQQIAEDKMNIPAIIDAADMALPEPDDLSVMAYVSYFRHYEAEKAKTAADPAKTYAEGPGVEGGCKTCDTAKFVVHALKSNGAPYTLEKVPFEVKITDPEGKEIEPKVERGENGLFNVDYMPTKPGKYNVSVCIQSAETNKNEPIKGSPYTPEILAGISGANCLVSGPGVDGGDELDDCNDAEFTIQAKDIEGNEIKEGGAEFEVKVHDPSGEDMECEVKDNGDGTYSCKYAPDCPGVYSVDIDLKNDTHDKVGKAPYEVSVGEGVDNNSTGVDFFQFTINARTKKGQAVKPGNATFSVKIVHESGTEIPQENIKIENLEEAKYRVTYKTGETGDYTIHCLLNNRDNKGSPWVQTC
uniref:Actin binding protein, putative n=1 Tax=Entamoeba invadens TaxID=33085 RepID=S0B340_ENTIV|nr:actin binding protein, putative [Entamoeba invadens]